MPQPRSHYVDANGVRLHYIEWNAAAPQGVEPRPLVLMLHGGSAHAHWWDFVARELAEDYRLIALDMRGHGESGHADPPAYELEDYVADCAALVRALGVERLTVMGHSMGAVVAVAYASRALVRVDAVIFIDILVRPSPTGKRMLDRLGKMPHPVYASRDEGVRRFRLLPSATGAPAPVLAHVAAHALRDRPGGGCIPKFDRASLHEGVPRDISAELASLKCPVLYIRGARSTLVPPQAVAEVKALAPHARTVEIPGAYHHVMLDNPAEFERVVRGFLAETHRR